MAIALPLLIVFCAGILTGATGFGFSVLSTPLLLALYAPHEVVAIVLCLVPVTSAVLLMTPGLRGRAPWRTVGALTASSCIGLPIGVALFERVDPRWVTTLIGVILVAYAWFGLRHRAPRSLGRAWAAPSGIFGGMLASSTGLSGPAVAMYVHSRRFAAREQAAAMAAYVGLVSVLALSLLAWRGMVTGDDLQRATRLSLGAVSGTLLGRWWAEWQHASVERVTLLALGTMGVWTVARVLARPAADWLAQGVLR